MIRIDRTSFYLPTTSPLNELNDMATTARTAKGKGKEVMRPEPEVETSDVDMLREEQSEDEERGEKAKRAKKVSGSTIRGQERLTDILVLCD